MYTPNIQNIPVLPRPDPRIRQALFGRVLRLTSGADYSGIENRLLAVLRVDPKDPYGFRKTTKL